MLSGPALISWQLARRGTEWKARLRLWFQKHTDNVVATSAVVSMWCHWEAVTNAQPGLLVSTAGDQQPLVRWEPTPGWPDKASAKRRGGGPSKNILPRASSNLKRLSLAFSGCFQPCSLVHFNLLFFHIFAFISRNLSSPTEQRLFELFQPSWERWKPTLPSPIPAP